MNRISRITLARNNASERAFRMAMKDNDDRVDADQDGDISLDMSQAAVKKMISDARERSYNSNDQLNAVLPEQVFPDQIEDVMSMLSEMGIQNTEEEESEETEETLAIQPWTTVAGSSVTWYAWRVPRQKTSTARMTRSACTCAKWALVELLSREGEIAIAKRIEAGRNTMILGLCESLLTFEAMMVWRDELRPKNHFPT